MANRNYFNNLPNINAERKSKGLNDIYASSQYIVGLDGEVIQCIPDDEVAYHAGNYSMNRKSVGIEVCHPDWNGKFNDKTYKSLIELCVILCKKYNIPVSHIIRHYDVTGKDCPHYYVQNKQAWDQLKKDIASLLDSNNQNIYESEGSNEQVRIYKNGSTREDVYADSNLTNKIGSLSPYEQCDCFGIFNDRPMVRYKIDGSNNYKIGFCKWKGGVK